jgi:putative NIF3 family GTP cyclohydrolase 1 type 2
MLLYRYPEELADKSWDNVGLLLENIDPNQHQRGDKPKPVAPIVMVTNDLTIRVAEESIREQASVIVAYRTANPDEPCPSCDS